MLSQPNRLFTIGNFNSYCDFFDTHGWLTKTGKRPAGWSPQFLEPYSGGYAVQTFKDAERLLLEKGQPGYSIFTLDGEWHTDTESTYDGWWHYLLHDLPMHFIVNIERVAFNIGPEPVLEKWNVSPYALDNLVGVIIRKYNEVTISSLVYRMMIHRNIHSGETVNSLIESKLTELFRYDVEIKSTDYNSEAKQYLLTI